MQLQEFTCSYFQAVAVRVTIRVIDRIFNTGYSNFKKFFGRIFSFWYNLKKVFGN